MTHCLDRSPPAWQNCPMTTAHANCTHPATKADRLACRKAHQANLTKALDLLAYFDARRDYNDWVLMGAQRFGNFEGSAQDRTAAALSLLTYFAPSGDEATDARRRANGYTITTSPAEIRSIILRSFS